MHVSLEHSVISFFAVSLVLQCELSATHYFEDREFNPSYHGTEENAVSPTNSGNPYETHPDYSTQGNYFTSDGWFAGDTLPTQYSCWTLQVSESLTPPVYAESQFNSVISEPEDQFIATYQDFSPVSKSQFQRGRSDIDPEEDEEEFKGYFYPKPKIPFDLPDFNTVNVAANEQPDATIITTTAKDEESSTEKTTTITTTTTIATTTLPAESSMSPIDKV